MATFQVRARTVDMLGRQQIAGIPTAISELFKNAHDAYARNVEVDYFRDDGLFVLRDDGLGMTREDFEQRWLTLGTESKLGSAGLKPPPRDPDQPKRTILGEKGIGRLAIAIIGPQVLVLTRARIDGKPANTAIAAYIHWGLFELPGLNLDDIDIPVREFQGGTLPAAQDVNDMVQESIAALDKLDTLSGDTRTAEIQQQMKKFNADPLASYQYLGAPSLIDEGCGTHFYILPADSIIQDDIDTRQAYNKSTRFESNLIGFTNTMTPGYKSPPIISRFRDHRDEGSPIELIGEKAFFTPQEFQEVDHHFIGQFDEYGQFQGTVGIYQMKPEEYVLSWSESDGRPTECGPFSLSFAYMQGAARDSLVPPEEHARLRRKLDRHGGLYIYRDGVRVQPYGDSDYDWLDIERNRTLGAAYYFYSYRRMLGVIELSTRANRNLTEKAGREGFRENKAYRQMRSILMNFFLQTAGDFFREEGRYSDVHVEKKQELNRNEEIRRKKAGQVRQKRAALHDALEKTFRAIDDRKPELQAGKALSSTKQDVDRVLRRNMPSQQKALALMRIEKDGRDQIRDLRSELAIVRPRGVGLSRELTNEWTSYQTQMERLDSEVFRPAEAELEEYVSATANAAGVPLDDVARLNAAVSGQGGEAVKSTRQLRGDIESVLKEVVRSVKEETRDSFRSVSHAVDKVVADLQAMQRDTRGIDAMSEVRQRFLDEIAQVHDKQRNKLERIRDQLNEVRNLWASDGFDSAELTEALEEELDELRTQKDLDLDLAQIGLALNTISHEFDKTVGALRDGLRRLKAWADANSELADLYRDIRVSFDHLDEYLTLFTPLDRRLHRTAITITGKEIFDFLNKLFDARFGRHGVKLKATKAFLAASVVSYPSSIYPPFVNLVDNSIFWLQRVRDRAREIKLDADGKDLLVCDNGPGVSSRDRESIFSMNFSRKPGGRGMGLYISRDALSKVGFDLTLDGGPASKGAIFRIARSATRGTAEAVENGS